MIFLYFYQVLCFENIFAFVCYDGSILEYFKKTMFSFRFAGLHLDSKDHVSDDAAAFVENSMVSESFLTSNSGVVVSSVQQTCDTDERNGSIDFDYHTPPSSPDPVYIYEGIPSKDDEELAVALSLVS